MGFLMKNLKKSTLLIFLAAICVQTMPADNNNNNNNSWKNLIFSIAQSVAPIIATKVFEFSSPKPTPSNLQNPISQDAKVPEHPMFERAKNDNALLLQRRAALAKQKPQLPRLPIRIAHDKAQRAQIANQRAQSIESWGFRTLAFLAELTHRK